MITSRYAEEWKQIGTYPSSWKKGETTPKRNYPITPAENLRLVLAGRKPLYFTMVSDMRAFNPEIIPDSMARAFVISDEPFFGAPGFRGGKDMFGVEWEYIEVAGGSMVRPGNPMVPDINEWEKYVRFPNLDDYDWEGSSKRNAHMFDKDRPTRCWIMTGLNERLISLMDFQNVLLAYIDEDQKPGVHRFYDALSNFYCSEYIPRLKKYFDFDILMFNDDWGTARDAQFSPDTAREMLLPYLKRIVDRCHEMGILFELHSCGKNDKLVPVFVEAGVDIWMPQNKVNDFDLLYRLCGKDILLGIPTETTPDMPDEDAFEAAKAYVRRFGKDGHVIVSDDLPPQHPKMAEWLYALSRDFLQAD